MGQKQRKYTHKQLNLLRAWMGSPVVAAHSFSKDGGHQEIQIDTRNCPKYHRWYSPVRWWDFFKELHNNCYNYALNVQFNHFSFLQPGEIGCVNGKITSERWEDMNRRRREGTFETYRKIVMKFVEHDGLTFVGKEPEAVDGFRLVALVMRDMRDQEGEFDRDFHWFRQDRDGSWSHKPGNHSPERLKLRQEFKKNAKTIVYPHDPKADLGRYNHFIGYYLVPEKLGQDVYQRLKDLKKSK